jgi:putative phosphoesterase
MRIGLVSDTHGRFEPVLVQLFARCDAVLHAGDVMGREILFQLESLAPLTAVRGNNDLGDFGAGLAEVELLRLDGLRVLLIHELGRPDRPNAAARAAIERERPDVVVYGHSHKPNLQVVGGVLYVNPGSAGPRRFSLPKTAGVMTVAGRRVRVELFDLEREGLPPWGEPFESVL